jgi:hypothetical protein
MLYCKQEAQPKTINIKDALEHLQQEHLIVNKISDAILNNVLASDSILTYSTDQLVQSIKQKYCPQASKAQINSVLSNLGGQINRVASKTKHLAPV